jgi:squalene-associated FAD-dependent desaturase
VIPTAHIIGGGLAGLAAALTALDAGYRVVLYEATPHLGGRCRAFTDDVLGCTLDNGTHLVLGCNRAVFAYLRRIGATDRLRCLGNQFPMHDLADGTRFTVGAGWPRLPGIGTGALLRTALALLRADASATVAETFRQNERLLRLVWRPLCVAILNTPPEQASLALLRRTLREMLTAGHKGLRGWLPVRSLTHTFIDPAAAALLQQGGEIRFGMRLKALQGTGRIETLLFTTGNVPVREGDQVILALPPQALAGVTGAPELPDALRTASTIVNVHFHTPDLPATPAFCGMVGGLSDWVFRKDEVVSVTISAAHDLAVPYLAARVWGEVLQALRLPPLPLPPHRMITEKRATPLQTPAFAASRPSAGRPQPDQPGNLVLVGDWTATGIPCTIESALRSGGFSELVSDFARP